MITIYKYELNAGVVGLPKGAQILTIQVQNGLPYIWALIDTEVTITEFRWFAIVGTGQEITQEYEYNYLATFQQDIFVWHVFELKKKL